MPFQGNGVFSNPYDWQVEANNGNNIDPAKFKTQDDGVATGLSNTITRDGQSTVIADIPFNNNKITGLKDATADQDALNRRTGDGRFVRRAGASFSDASSVAAAEINCALGSYFYKTASGALSWTFTSPPAAGAYGFILELTNGGLGTQTWPASVKWPSNTEPVLSSAGLDLLVFITRNGGTSWHGRLASRDSS